MEDHIYSSLAIKLHRENVGHFPDQTIGFPEVFVCLPQGPRWHNWIQLVNSWRISWKFSRGKVRVVWDPISRNPGLFALDQCSLHLGGLDLEGLDVSLMWFYSLNQLSLAA